MCRWSFNRLFPRRISPGSTIASPSLAAAAIGGCVLLWAWFCSRGEKANADATDDRISLRFAAAVIALTCIFFALAGWMVAASHLRYLADAGYFIEQMSSHAEYGGALYTQLEFAYGPLLFYPTILLHATLHCGWMTAYFLTLALDQSVGLALVAYVLNELPIRGRDRRIGFVLFAIGALNPIFGLELHVLPLHHGVRDSSFRDTSAVARANHVCAGRGRGIAARNIAGTRLRLSHRNRRVRRLADLAQRRQMAAGVGRAGGRRGSFLLLAGRSYLYMLHSFAKGALSLPVAPYPHILIFLFAVVWLIPFAIGRSLGSGEPISVRMAACYALGIGLLPAALGRSDPLHVFFNGAGLLVLSLAASSLLFARPAHDMAHGSCCYSSDGSSGSTTGCCSIVRLIR